MVKRASHIFVKLSFFLINATITLAAEEKEATVTYTGSVTPGKHKTKAR